MVDEFRGSESLVGGYATVIKHGVNATDNAKGIQRIGPPRGPGAALLGIPRMFFVYYLILAITHFSRREPFRSQSCTRLANN
jgi:hypothetical protein